MLDDIIVPIQSSFIPGRMIIDNALIAFECINTMQKAYDDKGSFCAYKLDLAKSYDHVDWEFLEGIMNFFGFANQWIRWTMRCVTSLKYAVRFNGALLQSFTPSRGLRQGGLLSLYLFLFVADGLSTQLHSEIATGNIQELKICRGAPGISHLLFTDDSLLFIKANRDQASRIKQVLTRYEKATDQLLSPSKFSIMFGKSKERQ